LHRAQPQPRSVLLVMAAVSLLCGACGPARPAVSGTDRTGVAVVAVENVWGDIARQIGGNHVRVTSILTDPSVDPHTFDADPRAAAALSAAALVIKNGLGYDTFADKLLASSPSGSRHVLTIAAAVGASGTGVNPHLWYSPIYVQAAAVAITDQLVRSDPAGAADFQQGLRAFRRMYQPYVDTLAAIKAKYGGAPVSFTERVPGYLVLAAGLRLATPATFAQAIEDGTDPSPDDVAAINRAITSKTVKVLLYNAQVTSPATDKVKRAATASGVPVVGVSETIPAGERDFQTWQIDQAKAVFTALGG
jgi:zinc/manganese transport system substrate-binding protein